MNILKPLKHGNVLTEEEALKDLENASSTSQNIPITENVSETTYSCSTLGIDCGLVLINKTNQEICTTDGEDVTCIGRERGYHRLHYNGTDLYYTRHNKLYRWPSQEVQKYYYKKKAECTSGITEYDGETLVGFQDGIYNEKGERKYGSGPVKDLIRFQNRLFSIQLWRGKYSFVEVGVEAKKEITFRSRLAKMDDLLLLGLECGSVFSFDGVDMSLVFASNSQQRLLCATSDRQMYFGGFGEEGLWTRSLYPRRKSEAILQEKIKSCTAGITVPLDFIEHLNKTK